MNKQKHTENTEGSDCPSTPCSPSFASGPWEAEKHPMGHWGIFQRDYAHQVAEAFDRNTPPEVVEANAKLIAAAPELHKAANEMVRLLEWLRMDSYIRGYLMAESDALKEIENAANCLLENAKLSHEEGGKEQP
jgi:hypothetical protein